MTMLTDFLLARIAEDEAAARASVPVGGRRAGKTSWQRRVAECTAKRAIVGHCKSGLANGPFGESTLAEAIAQHLAQVYADHPDYQHEWSTNG